MIDDFKLGKNTFIMTGDGSTFMLAIPYIASVAIGEDDTSVYSVAPIGRGNFLTFRANEFKTKDDYVNFSNSLMRAIEKCWEKNKVVVINDTRG